MGTGAGPKGVPHQDPCRRNPKFFRCGEKRPNRADLRPPPASVARKYQWGYNEGSGVVRHMLGAEYHQDSEEAAYADAG